MDTIGLHINQVREICVRHHVSELYVFGSILRPDYDPVESDLDFLYVLKEMDPLDMGDAALSLYESLQGLFKKKIDLVSQKAITNPYFKKNIEASKKLIYAAG